MSLSPNPLNAWPDLEATTLDGRRQRSDRSRRQIIEAMFELMRSGVLAPRAVEVAEKANVGLRTVFRHFEDMESIFEEMTEQLMAITLPFFQAPLRAQHWRDRLFEMVNRNARLYEFVFPIQTAAASRRPRSDFLQKQHKKEIKILRDSVKSVLPNAVAKDRILVAAIEANLAFSTWHRLREDQNLSVKLSKDTLKRTMTALTADFTD